MGTDQSHKFVYVVTPENKVEYRMVKLGPVVDGLRVVREGLKAEDWIIINGLMTVGPGSTVAPTRAAPAATGAEATASAP